MLSLASVCDEGGAVLVAVQSLPSGLTRGTLRAAQGRGALRASWTATVRDAWAGRRSGRQDGRLDRTTG